MSNLSIIYKERVNVFSLLPEYNVPSSRLRGTEHYEDWDGDTQPHMLETNISLESFRFRELDPKMTTGFFKIVRVNSLQNNANTTTGGTIWTNRINNLIVGQIYNAQDQVSLTTNLTQVQYTDNWDSVGRLPVIEVEFEFSPNNIDWYPSKFSYDTNTVQPERV